MRLLPLVVLLLGLAITLAEEAADAGDKDVKVEEEENVIVLTKVGWSLWVTRQCSDSETTHANFRTTSTM